MGDECNVIPTLTHLSESHAHPHEPLGDSQRSCTNLRRTIGKLHAPGPNRGLGEAHFAVQRMLVWVPIAALSAVLLFLIMPLLESTREALLWAVQDPRHAVFWLIPASASVTAILVVWMIFRDRFHDLTR